MMRPRSQTGFALLEILAASLLLAGLTYLFISFSKIKAHQIHNMTIGKNLALLTNDVVTTISTPGKTCYHSSSKKITDCITLSDDFKNQLIRDGLQIDQSTVSSTISQYCPVGVTCTKDTQISALTVQLIFPGPILAVDAQLYTPQIFNGLTPTLLGRLNAELPNLFMLLVRKTASPDSFNGTPADSGDLMIQINIEDEQ